MKLRVCLSAALVFAALGMAHAAPVKATAPRPLQWRPLDEPGCGGWMVGMRISPHDPKRMLVTGDMLSAGLSADGGKTFQTTLGFKTYEMGDSTWHPRDPQTVWVGTVSGPYVSHDGGLHWLEKRQGMPAPLGFGNSAPIEKVLFDPRDVAHLIALGGSSRRWDLHTQDKTALGAVWESRDSGEHWTRLATLTADGYTNDPRAKPGVNIVSGGFAAGSSQRLYAALDGHGIRVSEDGGKTWTPRNDGLPHPNLERVIPHPTDPNIAFAALDNHPKTDKTFEPGGIFKTVDGGRHWVSISNGLRQNTGTDGNLVARYKGFAVCDSNSDVMYTNDWAYDAGISYVTHDGGAHWRAAVTKGNFGVDSPDPAQQGVFHLQNSQPAGLGMTVFTVDPNNPDVAYGLSSDTIIGTRDGGKTWFDALSYHPAGVKSPDAWRGRGYTGWVATNFRFNPYKRGQSLFQAMDAARVWLSSDDLTSWTRFLNFPAPWGGGQDCTFTPDGHIYATTGTFNQTGIGRSTDGGRTWVVLTSKADPKAPEARASAGMPDPGTGGSADGIYARPDAPNRVWAVWGSKVYASADSGDSWKPVFASRGLHWIAADPRNPKRFYVSGDKNVYVTDDGATFAPIGGPHSGGRIIVDALGRVLVAARTGDRGGVWRWDGKAWTRLWDDGQTSNIAADPSDPKRLALITQQDPYKDYCESSGVWVSADDGKTWAQASDDLGELRGTTVAFDPFRPTRLVCGTEGRGFFVTDWPNGYVPTGGRTYTSTPDDTKFAAAQGPDQPAALTVRNGDMTDGTTLPGGWDQKFIAHGDIQAARDTTVFKSAPASLVSSTNSTDAEGNVYEMIDASAGTTFTLSGVVKTQGVAAQVAVQDFGGGYNGFGWQQASFQNADTDWTPFSKTLTLPEGTAHAALVLWVKGKGKAWLDDVKISDVKYPAGTP